MKLLLCFISIKTNLFCLNLKYGIKFLGGREVMLLNLLILKVRSKMFVRKVEKGEKRGGGKRQWKGSQPGIKIAQDSFEK